jgi:uncharacterized repeat protein (TIGR02543 family)
MFGALAALVPVLLLSCADPIEDLTIKNNYIITFDTHGGTEILPKYFASGSEVYPHSFTTQKDGHTLIGWFDSESGGSRLGGDGGMEKIPISRNMVFHAQWGAGGHTVRFETSGGAEVSPVRVPHEGILFPAAYASVRPAQGFAGWWDESGSVQYREPFSVTEDRTLYAHWSAGHITVRFISNGGGSIHAVALQVGNSLDLSPYVPAKAHSSFAGWFTDEACTTPNKVDSVSAETQDIILYAKWELGSHTVSFDTPGGSTVPSLLVTHGGILNPASYVSFKDGYGFVGWFAPDKTTQYTAPITVSGDLTLYAVWDYGHHTVNFAAGSGAAPPHPIRVPHGGTIDPSAYISSKPGCGFAGWWDQESGGIRYSGTITVNSDLTLYAHWDESKWIVSFNTHGGAAVADLPLSKVYNQLNVDAITAARNGYAFKGWFSAETGGVQYSGTAFAVTSNMTMHAQWEILRFAVLPNGAQRYLGDAVITYKNGTSIAVTVDISGAVRLKSGSWSSTGPDIYESFQPDGGSPFLIGRRVDSGTIFLRISPDKNLKLREPAGGFIPIGSYAEFQLISGNRSGKFKQEADLDFLGDKGRLWEPVSDYANKFTGSFDGGGKKIYNLKIEKNENYASIFGYVSDGTLNDIHVESGSVTSTADLIGSICGNFYSANSLNNRTLSNCTNKASVSGGSNVGGIAGFSNGILLNCANYGTVTGAGDKVGGLTGGSWIFITGCQNSGTVSGPNMVGGIVGEYSSGVASANGALSGSSNSGAVTGTGDNIGGLAGTTKGQSANRINGNCYNTGAVRGNSKVGGIIGNGYYASISNVYNTGTIQALGDYAGGIAGYGESGGVSNGENRGAVTGQNLAGGIAGGGPGFSFNTCTNKAAVRGTDKTGGIVGEAGINIYIANCFNEGAVTGTGDYAGGLMGYGPSGIVISNSGNKASGTVQGVNYVGGIAGANHGRNAITNSYNQAAVTASGNYSGGVAGSSQGNGVISNGSPGASIRDGCYNTGTVRGVDYVGGIAGISNGECAEIKGSYNQGAVTGTGGNIGGLAGSHSGYGAKITGSYNQGAVTGTGSNVGGLAGIHQARGGIENSYNQGAVRGTSYVGGVAGLSTGKYTTITGSYNEGTVTATDNLAGGVAGANTAESTITGSYNKASGTVSGLVMVAGVAGMNTESTISNSYNLAPVTGTHSRIAGIAGYTYKGSISNCYNTGKIENTGAGPVGSDSTGFRWYVGGIAGDGAGPISGSNNSGVVNNPGGTDTGGISGSCNSISACYNTGAVSGATRIGGIAGTNNGTVTACYNTGAVTGSGNVGGVAGYNETNKTIIASYNTGTFTGTGSSANLGGVAGVNKGTLTACYNTGSYSGSGITKGGVMGEQESGSKAYATYWTGNASDGYGHSYGSVTETTKFAQYDWPSTGSGSGRHAQWGTGDGSGDNKWWKDIGDWNSGSPKYPKLYFEQ